MKLKSSEGIGRDRPRDRQNTVIHCIVCKTSLLAAGAHHLLRMIVADSQPKNNNGKNPPKPRPSSRAAPRHSCRSQSSHHPLDHLVTPHRGAARRPCASHPSASHGRRPSAVDAAGPRLISLPARALTSQLSDPTAAREVAGTPPPSSSMLPRGTPPLHSSNPLANRPVGRSGSLPPAPTNTVLAGAFPRKISMRLNFCPD